MFFFIFKKGLEVLFWSAVSRLHYYLINQSLAPKGSHYQGFYCIKLPCYEAAPSSPTILDKTLNWLEVLEAQNAFG
jgi:hypothetical protein